MSIPIQPLEKADLPELKKSMWKMLGPGAVLVGLSIGGGEIVVWPWIAAKFGATMLWAAALGVFIQLWVNIEVGRWADLSVLDVDPFVLADESPGDILQGRILMTIVNGEIVHESGL